MSTSVNSLSPSTGINLSGVSSACASMHNEDRLIATPIHVIHTPSFIPRVNSAGSNLNALVSDGFHLTSTNPRTHSFSQLLSNSHLHDQVASEVDYSAYVGKQKHLFAHAPGTTYYHAQSLFSVSYKHLLCVLTFLFSFHWFNDGIFQWILTSSSHSAFNSTQSTLILSASLVSIVLFAPIIGYIARLYPPLTLLWTGFCIILLSTFITSFAQSFIAMFCARLLMGFGAAFVIPIAAPLVLYTAPPAHKSLMLSIFLCSMPLGYSLGYFVASQLLHNVASFSWQQLFCWETIFLVPIVIYSWHQIKGPKSFLAMTNYNIGTHNICDILSNQIYVGIVIGHTLQGFGCCILTIIVWNKLNDAWIAEINWDPYEIWSVSIFVLGTIGIIIGGLSTDYWHNKSVFHAKKRKKRKRKYTKSKTPSNEHPHKESIAASSNQHDDDGDTAQCHSLGGTLATNNNNMSSNINIPIKEAQTPQNIHPAAFISKSMDYTQSNRILKCNPRSLNSDGIIDIKESIEQYKLRKFIENQQQRKWTANAPHVVQSHISASDGAKASLVALKQEQIDAKKKRKKKRKKRNKCKKRFKPITNLHTIRICLYKVIIPTSLLCFVCIALLYFFTDNLLTFGILALIAQILTFVQVSALYTSMLWLIGIEWQCFGCGVAQIGFQLAGDGISPGLISNVLLEDPFDFDLLVLIIVMLISILIFFISWKYVDFQIWNITKNNKNSKMFHLLYENDTTTISTSTLNTVTNIYTDDNDTDTQQTTLTSSASSSCSVSYDSDDDARYYFDAHDYGNTAGFDEESQTNENSDYSASDWNPGNY